MALVTSGGYKAFAAQYDPYGLQTITEDSGGYETRQNPFTFAGGIQDRATKFVHYGQRYYDPATGTWTQRDTLDNPLSPANANRYAYAGGDPINKTDPTGQVLSYAICRLFVNVTNTVVGLSTVGVGAVEGVSVGVGIATGAGTSVGVGQFVDIAVGDTCTQSNDPNSFGHFASATQP